MSGNQQLVDEYMERAVEEFKHNPLARKLLRRLSDEMPDQFFWSAVRRLENDEVREADRFLTVLLMGQPRLFDLISNPAAAVRERSVRITLRVVKCDPAFDVRLARKLPDRGGQNHHEAFQGIRATRVLDILDEVSTGRRLLPVLYHLVHSQDPKLRERATLFVGRRVRTVPWAARQMESPDPRVRANALESIWGLDHPDAVSLMQVCVQDPNNRVAGNALMGLHILQCPGVEAVIPAMAANENENFRSTAAWMMGQLACPEFIPDLMVLVGDESTMVRDTARLALAAIHRAEDLLRAEMAAIAVEPVAAPDEGPLTGLEAIPEAMPLQPVEVPFDLHLDGSSFRSSRK